MSCAHCQGAMARMAMLGLVVTRATAVAVDTPGVPANCWMIFSSMGHEPKRRICQKHKWKELPQPSITNSTI